MRIYVATDRATGREVTRVHAVNVSDAHDRIRRILAASTARAAQLDIAPIECTGFEAGAL